MSIPLRARDSKYSIILIVKSNFIFHYCRIINKFKHIFSFYDLKNRINFISQKEFNKDTYKEVFEAADQVYLASRQVEVVVVSLDETQSAFTSQNQPQPSTENKDISVASFSSLQAEKKWIL